MVDGLAESGVVTEAVPAQRTGAGRPSLMVLPAPQAAVVLAVDVRVDQVAMAVVGLGGQVLGRHSWNLHRAHPHPRRGDHARRRVGPAAHRGARPSRRAGAGISVPGVVRRDDGWVHEAPNLGWRDVALGARLGAVLRMPVQVANDAELGALAEHVRGLARGATDLVYVSADFGVGGGVISEGRPLRGARGYVGEIGHWSSGPTGGRATAARAAAGRPRSARRRCAGRWACRRASPRGVVVAELRALATALAAGARADPLDEFAEWLATGLVTVVNMLAPELVVLGDLFTALPPPVVDGVRADGARAEPGQPGGRRHPDRDQPAGPRREARGGGGAGLRAGAGTGVGNAYAGLTASSTSRPAIEITCTARSPTVGGPAAGTRSVSPRAESVTALGSMGATRRLRSRRPNSTSRVCSPVRLIAQVPFVQWLTCEVAVQPAASTAGGPGGG